MNRFLALFLLAIGTLCQAAEITIVVPPSPIQPGEFVMLEILGIEADELKGSKATLTPSEGVKFFPVKFWNDKPFLFFQASTPGKYQISVALNSFRADLHAGLSGATESKIDSGLLAELVVVVNRVGERYPLKSGIAILEVAGTPLPPPPPPPPPFPTTSGVVWTVVIRTVDTMTSDQSRTLSDLRQWTDQQPAASVGHLEFPPDAVGPDGSTDTKVAAFVKKIPVDKTQPYVFLTQARKDGKNAILWHGELPPTADPVIAKIKEFVQP